MGTVVQMTKPDPLVEHANAIRALGKKTVEQTVANVIEIGRRLSECQGLLKKDGLWRAWIKTEFGWGRSSADNFINVFEMSTKSECPTVGHQDLPLKTLYLLAAPNTDPKARDEIMARAKKGEKIKHKDVEKKVKASRKPKLGVLAKRIIDEVKSSAGGLTADQLKERLAKICGVSEQTVGTTTNVLAKKGELQDSGERRKTRAGGGRPAIVYTIGNGDPAPQTTKPKTASLAAAREAYAAAIVQHIPGMPSGTSSGKMIQRKREEEIAKLVQMEELGFIVAMKDSMIAKLLSFGAETITL